MGSKTNHKSNSAKARSSTGKQVIGVKQASKKKHQKWSRDRSECVRDALDRDADLLYNAFENPTTAPSFIPQTESVISLTESMQGLGR